MCMFVCPRHINYSVTKIVNNPCASLMLIQDPNFAITVPVQIALCTPEAVFVELRNQHHWHNL